MTTDEMMEATPSEPTVCPARRRWWRRRPPHVAVWRSMDIGSHQAGTCEECKRPVQRAWRGRDIGYGPWTDATPVPCTHGVGGVSTPACTRCARAWSDRGLR